MKSENSIHSNKIKSKISVNQKYSLFAYKAGNSFLHRCPAWVKILAIAAASVAVLCLPVYVALGLIVGQVIVAVRLKFSVGEILADLKPVLYYGFFVILIDLLNFGFTGFGRINENEMITGLSLNSFLEIFSWEKQKESVFLLVRIFCVMQSTSLVFKTSTSLEMRQGIWTVESFLRRIFHLKQKNVITNTVSMFLNFIPMVGKIWEQSKRAWFARGGKKGIKMYLILLPVLFSVGMKKAWNMARAVAVRQ